MKIAVENGYITVKCDCVEIASSRPVNDNEHKITVVREKNKAVKLYIDNCLDCSGYSAAAKGEINTQLESNAAEFKAVLKAVPYNEIITLSKILAKVGKRKK